MTGRIDRTWIVADTNYFLHFQSPDQIDWHGLVESRRITIVVPMTVIDELDKHKNAQSSKLRARAKAVITKLKDVSRTDQKLWGPSVQVEIAPEVPTIDLAAYGLDRNRPDDQILAFTLSFTKMNGVDPSRVFLVSNDFGMELKSAGRGIKLLALPEAFQIASEPDSTEKEIRELKKQNSILANRAPKLSVSLGNSGNIVEVQLSEVQALTNEALEEKVDRIKSLHPLHVASPPITQGTDGALASEQGATVQNIAAAILAMQQAAGPSPKQWEDYNSDLNSFYIKYREYLRATQAHRELLARSVFIDLYLVNSGTTPACDVRVNLHFPDGFELIEAGEFPDEPEKPTAPKEPRISSFFEMLAMGPGLHMGPPLDYSIIQRNTEQPNIRDFSIEPTNSYEVSCRVIKAMHGAPIFLQSIVAIFESASTARSFNIDCKLICDELIETSKSVIHVVINR